MIREVEDKHKHRHRHVYKHTCMQLSIYEPQFNWQEHVGANFVVKIALTLLSSFEDLRLSKCDYELIESGWY